MTRLSRYSTSRTCRPLYQPQLLHTVCGSRDAPQFGHSECGGVLSRMFADLRERVAERLILRFGTAMDWLLGDLEVERPQGRPPGVEFLGAAFAGGGVSIDAALRAEAGAVLAAQGPGRQLEQQRVAHERLEVDHVVVEEVCLPGERMVLEQLVDVHGDVTLDGGEAPAACG